MFYEKEAECFLNIAVTIIRYDWLSGAISGNLLSSE
jgi:hypothetical protein